MALVRLFSVSISQCKKNVFKIFSAQVHTNMESPDEGFKKIEAQKDDMPVNMENPYEKEMPQCILCKYNIEPNYKNIRLLSQFVSRYTGKIYSRHITGLCEYKHTKLVKEIKKARSAALMPSVIKEPNYLNDPDLFDDTRPLRSHRF